MLGYLLLGFAVLCLVLTFVKVVMKRADRREIRKH